MLENKYEILFNLRYNFIYYITAFITLIFVLECYLKNRTYTKIQYYFLAILLLVIIFFFGTRGEFVGIDTPNNVKYFTGKVKINNLSDLKDIGIYFLSILISKISKNIDVFLTFIAALYIIPFYSSIKNLKLKNPLIFFFFLFSLFFFKSMGMNTVRQGLAFSTFFLGLVFMIKDRKLHSYILFVLSFFMHASIIIPIVILLIAKRLNNIKIAYFVYGICTLLALVNFKASLVLGQIPIVNILVEERLDTYYIDTGNYRIGFRPDFWLFNSIFAVIGYITLKHIDKFNSGFLSKNYKIFFVAYVLLSSFFFLMFSASFSDRFGFLSWMFIPLLLLPYAQSRVTVGVLNTLTVFFICVFLATIFKFI